MKEELFGVLAGLVVCYFYKVSDKNLIIITK